MTSGPARAARPDMASPEPNKPLMRSIGEFFGHIIRGIRHDVTKERHIIEEQQREEKQGRVVLRETRIREIEVRDVE